MQKETSLKTSLINSFLKEAQACYEEGLFSEAKEIYVTLLKELEEVLETEEVKTQKKLVEEKIKEIEDIFKEKKIISFYPLAQEEELYKRAINFRELGLYERAIDGFKVALKKGYKVEACLKNIIYCYKEQGLILNAIEFLKQLLSSPNFFAKTKDEIRYELAELYEKMGAYTEALFYFSQIANKEQFNDLEEKVEYLSLRVKTKTKYDYFLLKGIVKKEDLDKAISQAKEENKSVEAILIERYGVLKSSIGKALSDFYGCPFVSFDPSFPISLDLIKKEYDDEIFIEGGDYTTLSYLAEAKDFELTSDIKFNLCEDIERFIEFKDNLWVPLKKEGDKIFVAIDDPNDMERIEHIKYLLQTSNIKFVVSIKEDIEKFIDYFVGEKKVSKTDFIRLEEQEEEISERDARVVNFVNHLILDAWDKRASDIYIETLLSGKIINISYRIDGIYHPFVQLSKNFAKPITSCIKIMAKLDIFEKTLPQYGKISFRYKEKDIIEMRVETIPLVDGGEDMILHFVQLGGGQQLE
jgi:tetratricopeptide (TPR) repeat protein